MTTPVAKSTRKRKPDQHISATELWLLRKKLNVIDRRALDKLFGVSRDTRNKWINQPDLIPIGVMDKLVAFLQKKYPTRIIDCYTLLKQI